jgi:hypothetical protein
MVAFIQLRAFCFSPSYIQITAIKKYKVIISLVDELRYLKMDERIISK